MAFETGTSNLQANQLSEFIHQLNSIKNQLNDFCFSIERNWSGQEVIYYRKAIETIQNKINSINNQLQSVSDDIKNTAAAIRQEDLAAEAAARALAEKNRKISIANSMFFFNRDAIEKVFFIGFQDAEEIAFKEQVLDKLGELEIKDGAIVPKN